MPIVCDTDFSPAAQQTGRVAASLAQRLGEELYLVHVVDELGSEFLIGHEEDALLDPEREMLDRQTDALRQLGARVEARLVAGFRHVWLAEIASACRARLMVISHRPGNRLERLFGDGVEKILRSSPVPVLVAEGSDRLFDWLQGERCLRVLVGLDPSDAPRAALGWLAELDGAGPLEALVATFHRELGFVPAAQRMRRRRPRARWLARSARGERRAHGGMQGRA